LTIPRGADIDGKSRCAALDRFFQLRLPGIPPPQLILVEPDRQAAFTGSRGFLNALFQVARRLDVARRIAEEKDRTLTRNIRHVSNLVQKQRQLSCDATHVIAHAAIH
jgi:hypothetical protein